MNKSVGAGGQKLFDYSAEAPKRPSAEASSSGTELKGPGPLQTSASKAAAVQALPSIETLEGANADATFTKVVDRRWYERNKHIYPASVWQDFDPEKDYATEIRRDTGGNAFFFSK